MNELSVLYEYIQERYLQRVDRLELSCSLSICVYEGFEIEIRYDKGFRIYINNIFYYDVDSQDINDTIDEFFNGDLLFYEIEKGNKKLIGISERKKFTPHRNISRIWSMRKD